MFRANGEFDLSMVRIYRLIVFYINRLFLYPITILLEVLLIFGVFVVFIR